MQIVSIPPELQGDFPLITALPYGRRVETIKEDSGHFITTVYARGGAFICWTRSENESHARQWHVLRIGDYGAEKSKK